MLDIGFWELVVIAIIGIIVIGPEKLPDAIRSVMATVRKFRRMFDDVRHDIERELDIDEMRRIVSETDVQAHIEKLNQSVMDADHHIRQQSQSILDDIDREIAQSTEKNPIPPPARVPATSTTTKHPINTHGISNDIARERLKKATQYAAVPLSAPHYDGEAMQETGVEPSSDHDAKKP